VWVASFLNNEVTELSASTGALVRGIGGGATDIAEPAVVFSDGTDVWVADRAYNYVTELSASTGSVVRVLGSPSYGFDDTNSMSSDGTHLWLTNSGGGS